MKIDLRIDRIVLDGYPLPAADQRRMAESLQAELEQALILDAQAGRLSSGHTVRRAIGKPIVLTPGAGPTLLGRSVARSIRSQLGRQSEPMESQGPR